MLAFRVGAALALVAPLAALGCSGAHGNEDLTIPPSGGVEENGRNESTAEAESLFMARGGDATPGVLTGVWAATIEAEGTTYEHRVHITGSAILLATRCSKDGVRAPIASVKVAAKIDESTITTLDAKTNTTTADGITCRVSTTRGTDHRCDATHDTKSGCFDLREGVLVVYRSATDALELVKQSD